MPADDGLAERLRRLRAENAARPRTTQHTSDAAQPGSGEAARDDKPHTANWREGTRSTGSSASGAARVPLDSLDPDDDADLALLAELDEDASLEDALRRAPLADEGASDSVRREARDVERRANDLLRQKYAALAATPSRATHDASSTGTSSAHSSTPAIVGARLPVRSTTLLERLERERPRLVRGARPSPGHRFQHSANAEPGRGGEEREEAAAGGEDEMEDGAAGLEDALRDAMDEPAGGLPSPVSTGDPPRPPPRAESYAGPPTEENDLAARLSRLRSSGAAAKLEASGERKTLEPDDSGPASASDEIDLHLPSAPTAPLPPPRPRPPSAAPSAPASASPRRRDVRAEHGIDSDRDLSSFSALVRLDARSLHEPSVGAADAKPSLSSPSPESSSSPASRWDEAAARQRLARASDKVHALLGPDDADADAEADETDPQDWCCICNDDASVLCTGCEHDAYCSPCWAEGHGRMASDELREHRTVDIDEARGKGGRRRGSKRGTARDAHGGGGGARGRRLLAA